MKIAENTKEVVKIIVVDFGNDRAVNKVTDTIKFSHAWHSPHYFTDNSVDDLKTIWLELVAYLNAEPPVPRIEKRSNGNLFFINRNGHEHLWAGADYLNDLDYLECEIPIWQPVKRYKAEWKQTAPVMLIPFDIQPSFEFTDYLHEIEPSLRQITKVTNKINKQTTESMNGISIYKFTISKET